MKKYRFLCIDDSKAIHAFMAQCLAPLAVSIDVAMNGAEGVAKFQANPGNYDIVFLDWEMPVMDGPTTFKSLLASGIKIPVLMLTSKNEPTDIVQMIEAGVADYILKPFTEELIREKIAYVMGENG